MSRVERRIATPKRGWWPEGRGGDKNTCGTDWWGTAVSDRLPDRPRGVPSDAERMNLTPTDFGLLPWAVPPEVRVSPVWSGRVSSPTRLLSRSRLTRSTSFTCGTRLARPGVDPPSDRRSSRLRRSGPLFGQDEGSGVSQWTRTPVGPKTDTRKGPTGSETCGSETETDDDCGRGRLGSEARVESSGDHRGP